MRLSDIKGELVIDVIADLVAPVANIAMDKEASDLFTRKPLPVGMTTGRFMAERFKKSLPLLLKGHKKDLIDILSTLSLKTPEEYTKGLTIVTLINDAVDLFSDETFAQLFFSAQTSEKEESSGSVQENTEGGLQEGSSSMYVVG